MDSGTCRGLKISLNKSCLWIGGISKYDALNFSVLLSINFKVARMEFSSGSYSLVLVNVDLDLGNNLILEQHLL